MNWTEQAETMTKVWAETQKKMWENWIELSQTAPSTAPFYTNNPWQKMAAQGFEGWIANADPTVKVATQRLFAGQKAFGQFLEFSTQAWQKIAEKVASNGDWQSSLAEYSEQLRQQMFQSPERVFKMSQNTQELWQLYLEQIQKLAQPWMQSWQQVNGDFGQAMSGDDSALASILKRYEDAYEHTFGHLLEAPTLGYSRELNEKILTGFDAWQDLHQVNLEYQILIVDAWVGAFEKFQHHLVNLAEKGEPITSLEQLSNQWYNVADDAFLDVFRSEKYIRTQGELLSATLTYRMQQREIVELFLQINDLPTRTEVDEAHRNIHIQRKEIKKLKKTVAQLSGSAADGELQQAQKTIQTLRKEVTELKRTLAEVSAQAEQVDLLRKELVSLKETVNKAAPPKRTTRKKPQSATATTESKKKGA